MDATVLQMDNGAFEQDAGARPAVVEMGKVESGGCANVNGTCLSANNGVGAKVAPRPPPENPWHRLKSIFLVTILILLFLWLVTYILVDRNDLW
jgi:hypothetical protein